MRVAARDAVRELVRPGDPDDTRAGVEQRLHRGCVRGLGRAPGEERRDACADREPRDREQVLDRHALPAQRAVGPARNQRGPGDPPHARVERAGRRVAHVRRGDLPAGGPSPPELGLLPDAARVVPRDGDDESDVVGGALHVDLRDGACRGPAAGRAERGDAVVPDEQPACVTPQRRVAGGEPPVEGRDVVRHERRLVRPERLDEAVGRRVARERDRRRHAISAIRIRACTPFTRSTTCEMSKSVAALR
ncbi:hypothetical protein GCM10025864_22920 [Luteimicrobium album]|uniref:Uncharacterized protein n=1 Tax=Luteimicrobium album TaxID=1054550 RepID=A0ABQ6I3I8_9MICO|nr:hypothetical protein GCM10025864_22920 [Luteimicrobium album]